MTTKHYSFGKMPIHQLREQVFANVIDGILNPENEFFDVFSKLFDYSNIKDLLPMCKTNNEKLAIIKTLYNKPDDNITLDIIKEFYKFCDSSLCFDIVLFFKKYYDANPIHLFNVLEGMKVDNSKINFLDFRQVFSGININKNIRKIVSLFDCNENFYNTLENFQALLNCLPSTGDKASCFRISAELSNIVFDVNNLNKYLKNLWGTRCAILWIVMRDLRYSQELRIIRPNNIVGIIKEFVDHEVEMDRLVIMFIEYGLISCDQLAEILSLKGFARGEIVIREALKKSVVTNLTKPIQFEVNGRYLKNLFDQVFYFEYQPDTEFLFQHKTRCIEDIVVNDVNVSNYAKEVGKVIYQDKLRIRENNLILLKHLKKIV